MIKPILKNLKDKTLKFINYNINEKLQPAFSKFLEQGVKDGIVFNKILFAQNNFTDE